MAALRDTAHIKLDGRRLRILEGEPLEDSVRTVHAVMRRIASRNGVPFTYQGRSGYKSSLNLTGIVRSLTTDHGQADRVALARLISQVLRRTETAACLHRADPHTRADPVWFVANTLPANLTVIVAYVRGNSAAAGGEPSGFAEKDFLRYEERKLRPEEVGENLPAGEVTVTKRQLSLTEEVRAAKAEQALRVFADSHAENRRKKAEMTEQVYEFIATAPVVMTHPELTVLFNREMGTEWHGTTFRSVLNELKAAGRIVSRKETPAERLVRGGGAKVKATAPQIYHLPGDDAPRTRLPRGIEPLKSSVQWGIEKKRERESLENRVYRAMDVPNVPNSGHGAPRTPHMIAKAADISDREALETLERLVACGRVFYHPVVHYYAPMTRVRKTTIEKYADHRPTRDVTAEQLADIEVPDQYSAPGVAPEVTAAIAELRASATEQPVPEDLTALVRAEVARALGQEVPSAEEDALIASLTAENERLQAENARLTAAVAGLRQTLNALT